MIINEKADTLNMSLEVHMKHNASKLVDGAREYIAELSCEDLDCSIKLYPETKVFDLKLGSYQLSSPNGLLAEVGFYLYVIEARILLFLGMSRTLFFFCCIPPCRVQLLLVL